MKAVKVYIDEDNLKAYLALDEANPIPEGFVLWANAADISKAFGIAVGFVLLEKDLTFSSEGAADVARDSIVNFKEVIDYAQLFLLAKRIASAIAARSGNEAAVSL